MNNIKQFNLKNGLKVIYIDIDSSKNTTIDLKVLAGSRFENNDEIGVAHFLEHILLDGTQKYPSSDLLSEAVEQLGGRRYCSTNRDYINYRYKVLNEHFSIALDCLSQIILHPLFNESDIEKEKKIIVEEISRWQANPEYAISRHIYECLFPQTRFGGLVTGLASDVENINREKLLSFWRRTHIVANMLITVAGHIENLESKLEEAFSKVIKGETIKYINPATSSINELVDKSKEDSKTKYLSIALRSVLPKDRFAIDLLVNIIGRGRSSRLSKVLREQMGLVYSINTQHSRYLDCSVVSIKTSCKKENIEMCKEAIILEINRLLSDEINNDELEKAFNQIKSGLIFGFEDTLSVASFYSERYFLREEILPLEEIEAKYKEVAANPDSLKASLRDLLKDGKAVLII